jgi:prephenate dehydratase
MPGVPPARFVYLGPEGTFAEQAVRSLLAAAKAPVTPVASVPEALEAVRAGEADAAVVPLENSIGGQVGVTLDELTTGAPLVITREVVLPVNFVLAARAGAALESLASIAAHPQASTQCRRWLRINAPKASIVDVLSNGAAAVGAAAGQYDAAVCAPIGAERHGLAVIAKDIADRPDAVTRFAVVSRPGPVPPPTGDDVTSLVVYIAHDRVGALLAVLTELAVRGVNLTRIESRPTGEKLGRYAFFLDCEGHVAEVRMGEALQGLYRVSADVRFLGSYPRAVVERRQGAKQQATGPAGTSDEDFRRAAAWLNQVRNGELA